MVSRCIFTCFFLMAKKCLTPSLVRNSFQSVERAFNPAYRSKYDSSIRVHEIPKWRRKNTHSINFYLPFQGNYKSSAMYHSNTANG